MFTRFRAEFIELSQRSRAVIAQFGMQLAKLHRTRRGRIERALHEYVANYWPSLSCPVFRGFRSAPAARRVLGLLKALQVPRIRVICFAAADSATAAKWEQLLGWSRQQMTFRHPPNSLSKAARKRIAIDALFPVTGKNGIVHYKTAKRFSVLMRLVAQMVLIEQRRVESDQQREPKNREENE